MKPTEQINNYLKNLSGWKGEILTKLRKIIHDVEPQITEDWKWDVPIFSSNGMVCATASFSDHIKINFFKGALLSDPKKLFNAGLESKKTRAIDIFENDKIDVIEISKLIRQAIDANKK